MRSLVILVLLGATPVLAADAPRPAPKATAKPPATKAPAAAAATKAAAVPAGWEKTDVKDGGYSLVFPGKAEPHALTAENGEILAQVWILEKENGDVAFMASHSDIAKERANATPEEILKQSRDGALQQTRGTLVNEKKIAFEGNPGLELVIASPTGMVSYVHVILVKGRLYQFMAVMPKGHAALSEAKTFLESFRLLK